MIAVRAVSTLALLLGLIAVGSPTQTLAQANCSVSSPSPAYTVSLCITTPAQGGTLVGASTVTVSVTVTGSNPGINRLTFTLDGQYLLTDFQTPFTFILPTNRFVDGSHTLSVTALMRDGLVSQPANVAVSFNNGVSQPPLNTANFTPTSGRSGAGTFVVAAAGDGAGGEQNARNVLSLIDSWNPNLFLYLGDVYEKGSPTEFYNWYGNAGTLWDKLRSITNPAIGNHEYENGQAPGYFDYWGNGADRFSINAGGWHFVSINSTSQGGSWAVGSANYEWLRQDLESSTSACTIVFFHHPVFSDGPQGNTTRLNAVWPLLVQERVTIALAGHDHNYQRWYPLNGAGIRDDAQGVTQFVVGGGGHGIQGFARDDPRRAFGSGSSSTTYGALRLALNQGGASFQYVNTAGATLDSGVVPCGSDTTPPTAPTGVTATAVSGGQVDVAWNASSDDIGVANYRIYRGGTLLTTVGGAMLRHSDTTVVTSTTYSYTVSAVDSGGGESPQSSPASVTTPGSSTFAPIADTRVEAGTNANTNYGTSSSIRTDADPIVNGLLRFNVQGFSGPITRATLRVFANSSSSVGYRVHSVSGAWTETGVTYNTRPTLGSVVGSSGAVSSGTWTSVDVTSLVTGNGVVDLGLSTTSSTATSYSSREGANPPQLVVETGTPLAPTNTPTVTPTVGAANTPTVGATNTPTATPTVGAANTPTVTPTVGPTNSPTLGPTSTSTATPMVPTSTATATRTPTATP